MSTEALENIRRLIGQLSENVIELASKPEVPLPKLLTLEQTAEALAVGRTTVQELVDSGALPVVSVTERAVRVDARDVEAYIKTKRGRRG